MINKDTFLLLCAVKFGVNTDFSALVGANFKVTFVIVENFLGLHCKYVASANALGVGEYLEIGDLCILAEFVVLSARPMGNDVLIEVAFEDFGTKKLMANAARLEKV